MIMLEILTKLRYIQGNSRGFKVYIVILFDIPSNQPDLNKHHTYMYVPVFTTHETKFN